MYSAGVVLQECISGATPFQRDTPRDFLARKLEPGPSRRSVVAAEPRTLAELVAWMTAPEASERPRTMAVVSALLAKLE
jgi:hypothetical protein